MKPRILLCFAALGSAFLPGCLGPERSSEQSPAMPAADGLVVLFPGVINTAHHMAGICDLVRARHPHWCVDLRNWGTPLRSLTNLQAYERNVATARQRARELASYRQAHPAARITVLGYSGGGGMALFTVAALPQDVLIERLILIAPAISADYPVRQKVLPHVREFVVNYASRRDLQVGWGTHVAGTMDRVNAHSCGYTGFNLDDPRVVDLFWTPDMVMLGHLGNHLGYISPAWQEKYLAPGLDPGTTVEDLRNLFGEVGDHEGLVISRTDN